MIIEGQPEGAQDAVIGRGRLFRPAQVPAITEHSELLDAEPVLQHSIHLRNPYVDPLNYIQVEMLRRLRALPDATSEEAEALREVIHITINGIAAGLRNTG